MSGDSSRLGRGVSRWNRVGGAAILISAVIAAMVLFGGNVPTLSRWFGNSPIYLSSQGFEELFDGKREDLSACLQQTEFSDFCFCIQLDESVAVKGIFIYGLPDGSIGAVWSSALLIGAGAMPDTALYWGDVLRPKAGFLPVLLKDAAGYCASEILQRYRYLPDPAIVNEGRRYGSWFYKVFSLDARDRALVWQ